MRLEQVTDNIEFEFRKEKRKRHIKTDVNLEGRWKRYELSPPEFDIHEVIIPDEIKNLIDRLEAHGWTLGTSPEQYVKELY